jgi:hypothetical protein
LIKRNVVIALFAVFPLVIAGPAPALSGESPTIRDAPAPNTVLFLGNSFVFFNNGVESHLRKLTHSVLVENPLARFFNMTPYLFASKTIPGAHLYDHADNADVVLYNYWHPKKDGPWDLVVLQGQSGEPIYRNSVAGFFAAARRLDGKIRRSGSRTAFFMTWADKNRPQTARPLRDAYTRIGNELDALVVPVGVAFTLARRRDPAMELYAPYRHHPSLLGTYLAANVFFAALYGKSPVGASYTAGLSARQAEFAQTTAWRAVRFYFAK